MTSDAYQRIKFRDRSFDKITRAALLAAEEELGYELTIVQGPYNKGVGASAGTHDGGGVVDLAPWDWERKVTVLRKQGWAAWYRAYVEGLWGAHVHAVLIGHERLADAAVRQVTAYLNKRDGLKSNLEDTFWRPSKIVRFQYPPKQRKPVPRPTSVSRARDRLVEASVALGKAAVALDRSPETRAVAHESSANIRAMSDQIEALLWRLPKR